MQALRDESAAKIKEHTARSVDAEKKYQGLEQELKKTQTVVEKLESQLKEVCPVTFFMFFSYLILTCGAGQDPDD
jgi:wobble nucleotide-excising tRNase